MSSLKKLASQTAIYGLSSILGRFLNIFLTPLQTHVLSKSDFGVNTDVYAIIAFLMVVLTFGMETTFFRYYQSRKDEEDGHRIFSHTIMPVLTFSLVFLMLVMAFLHPIANALRYYDHPEYLIYMVLIVIVDAVAAVPFAKLRAENRAFRFVSLRLTQIILFVGFNYFFFMLCPFLLKHNILTGFINAIYKPELGVAYVFICNLIANGVMMILLLPEFRHMSLRIDGAIERKYLSYAAPLVLAGLAGIANDVIDRQFLKYLLPENIAFAQEGIYGANYKIATFMMMFIQAFRFAAEPFFFEHASNKDPKQAYAKVMKFFTIFQVLIFVGIIGYIDIVKLFIAPSFWEGLPVVPVLLFSNLLVGINLNLNIWYKLQDKTRYGAYITFFGCFFTVLLNPLLIPHMGIMGAAIATLVSYCAMTGFAYYLNQKHYHTPYDVPRILLYLAISIGMAYLFFEYTREMYMLNSLIILAFGCFLFFNERKELKTILG